MAASGEKVTTGGEGILEDVSPLGHRFRFQSKPYRAYWILPPGKDPDIDENWIETASVTTILGVLDKPALPWWGMRIGVKGLQELIRTEVVRVEGSYAPGDNELRIWYEDNPEPLDEYDIVDILNREKLTVNHVRDKAGERGTAAHDAFELWVHTGLVPHPRSYPLEERPYIESLLAFIDDVEEMTLEGSEIMVGSVKNRYAGRYDLRCRLSGDFVSQLWIQGEKKRKKVKEPLRREIDDVLAITDVKTSKDVFPVHFLQLEGYEGASIENGYEPTDERLVIHLTGDGRYQVQKSDKKPRDFVAVRKVYRVMEGK